MSAPYRQPALEQAERHRSLDPWKLALLFAWVCDLGRIGLGLLNRRPISGELGFAAVLAIITLAVIFTSRPRRPG